LAPHYTNLSDVDAVETLMVKEEGVWSLEGLKRTLGMKRDIWFWRPFAEEGTEHRFSFLVTLIFTK
jgi:hypothetical protein